MKFSMVRTQTLSSRAASDFVSRVGFVGAFVMVCYPFGMATPSHTKGCKNLCHAFTGEQPVAWKGEHEWASNVTDDERTFGKGR